MHDIDRTQLETGYEGSEFGQEIPELGAEQYEYPGEAGSLLENIFGEVSGETPYEYQEVLEMPIPETMETQLASEFLEISNEEELDRFLGSLIKRAASTIGKVVKSPIGQALGGVLKQVAKRALPIAGTALGSFVGGPLGGMIGGKLASAAGGMFGLETEGLSPEDRDFEVARRFVRFAGHAARRAAVTSPRVSPWTAAKAAVVDAAKRYAPGLLTTAADYIRSTYPPAATSPAAAAAAAAGYAPPTPAAGYAPAATGFRRRGTWFRRGRNIILVGA